MEKKFVRNYAYIPSYDALTASSQEALRETDEYLRTISGSDAACFSPEAMPPSNERDFWGHLEHDLSFMFDAPLATADMAHVEAVRRERLVAAESIDDFGDVMAQTDAEAFIGLLKRCCERFALPQEMRGGDIRTSSDRGGYVVFPRADALRSRMAELFDFLRAPSDGGPLFRSTVAMVLTTNAHPFADGNGRLSRLVSQLNLWNAGYPRDFYLPWPIFFHRSKGGILLRVRQAEIHGDWDDLFLSICRGISHTVARSRRERNDR